MLAYGNSNLKYLLDIKRLISAQLVLLAGFPGKKVKQVGPRKRLSEGGKWGLVEQA